MKTSIALLLTAALFSGSALAADDIIDTSDDIRLAKNSAYCAGMLYSMIQVNNEKPEDERSDSGKVIKSAIDFTIAAGRYLPKDEVKAIYLGNRTRLLADREAMNAEIAKNYGKCGQVRKLIVNGRL